MNSGWVETHEPEAGEARRSGRAAPARRARCGGDDRRRGASASSCSNSATQSLDRRVADGVHADLQAGGVRGAHARQDLGLRQRRHAALAGAIGERLAHVRGAAAEGAVGEDLEAADAAAGGGVVQRRGARRDRRVDAAADEDRVGREAAPASSSSCMASDSKRPVAPPGPSSSVCRTTPAEVMPQAARRANVVRAVAPQAFERRRRHGAEQALRGALEARRRWARRAASRSMRPPAGSGVCGIDAGRRQGGAVADGAVAIVLEHHDRPIGAGRVELAAVGRRRSASACVFELQADQPLARPAGAPRRGAACPAARRCCRRRAGRRSCRSTAGAIGCRCVSMKPGSTQRPPRSTVLDLAHAGGAQRGAAVRLAADVRGCARRAIASASARGWTRFAA